jgi:GNAT superfamily N-acetyltransferase
VTDSGVTIRLARPEDALAIAEIHVASWRAVYPGIVPQEILDGLSIDRRAASWSRVLAEPGERRTWVACRDGRPIGFAGTEPLGSDADTPAEREQLEGRPAELKTVYLVPDAIGAGIGRRLFGRAIDDLVERGYSPLILWVFTANVRARRFYEAAGWRPDGAAKTIDFGGTEIEEIRYRLDPPRASAERD